jgi:uncharacterized protein (TIGR02588 family)
VKKGATPALEWMMGFTGAALLIALVAFLTHDGITGPAGPGEINTQVIEIAAAGDSFIVRFDIHNTGGEALSNLQVSAHVMDGEEEIESVRAAIDYLPAQSSQEGGFFLRNDPRRYSLEIRPEGYQKP